MSLKIGKNGESSFPALLFNNEIKDLSVKSEDQLLVPIP